MMNITIVEVVDIILLFILILILFFGGSNGNDAGRKGLR
jgi:hypothetical protein